MDWSIGRPRQSAGDAFQQGMEIAERNRQARLERERIQAETELYRAQARAAIPQSAPAASQAVAPSQTDAEYARKWFEAARPRMGLFPDFEKVVFDKEARISPDMVMLMSTSSFAADIAYHLATHKAEATVIFRLPLLEAARAIDQIEANIKATQPATSAKP